MDRVSVPVLLRGAYEVGGGRLLSDGSNGNGSSVPTIEVNVMRRGGGGGGGGDGDGDGEDWLTVIAIIVGVCLSTWLLISCLKCVCATPEEEQPAAPAPVATHVPAAMIEVERTNERVITPEMANDLVLLAVLMEYADRIREEEMRHKELGENQYQGLQSPSGSRPAAV